MSESDDDLRSTAEAKDDLKSTAESIETDAARLIAIEQEKQELAPTDPKVVALSAEAERLAKAILPKAATERALAEGLQSS